MSTTAIPPEEEVMSVIEQYGAYPFDSDENYQQGLGSILLGASLESVQTAEVRDEILRRTRVFYFNKMTGNSLSTDEAREYEQSKSPRSPASSSAGTSDETRVLTFDELKTLIESGRVDQIPNNKFIPEKLSDEPPSESTAPVRRKPWESATFPVTTTESTS